MSTFDSPPRYRRHERAAEVLLEHDECTVVTLVPDGDALVLSGSSELIWMGVPASGAPSRSSAEIVAWLADSTDLDEALIRDDTERFLAHLAALGLVTATTGEPA